MPWARDTSSALWTMNEKSPHIYYGGHFSALAFSYNADRLTLTNQMTLSNVRKLVL